MKNLLPLIVILTLAPAGCQSYYDKAAHRENPGQDAPVFKGVVQPAPDPNQTGHPPPPKPTPAPTPTPAP